MGNQGSALGDGEQDAAAARQLVHFDHSYKAYLHTTSGPLFSVFGKLKGDKLEAQLTCLADSFDILVDALAVSDRKKCAISYTEIADVGWDHSLCEVKFNVKRAETEDSFIILHVPTSVELEHELKLRFNNLASSRQGVKVPSFMYVGMFAGSTKPKPFQRKRPNISRIPAGKLPPLQEMRAAAEKRHAGSYAPCPPGSSRRIDLAVQHIFDGYNTFPITYVKGNIEYSNKWCMDSIFLITESKIVFHPNGVNSYGIDFFFDDISHWEVEDLETAREKNISGITIYLSAYADNPSKAEVYFGFKFIRDVKHTFEFFWNKHQVAHGRQVKLGSTHGRPLVTVYTLSGEMPAPEPASGQIDIVDSDGLVVRPGHMVKPGYRTSLAVPKGAANAKRRNSLGINLSNDAIPLPPETPVKNHWRSIVKHQGWLLKKGGVGVGSIKQWIKRYFVLYSTSQGHFLVYYSDILECPMYTTERNQRNVVDLAKTTFIRPGSNKDDGDDVPPFSFDIQTTEREWTLCAESQENVYKWLQMLTRAVDEDVAIIPDEDIEFKVKAKVDPLGVLNPMDYSTSLMVSANAVCVVAPDPPGSFNVKQQSFWVYTDFYKWSLLSQNGKLALLVNVFSDSTFSKRMEFIFRTKEAVRLATAIEFFIEKFMTAMHIQLELVEGALDQAEDSSKLETGKLVHASAHDWEPDQVNTAAAEIDLLGFDEPLVTSQQPTSQGVSRDEFGLPLGPSSTSAQFTSPPQPPTSFNGFGDDPFGFNAPPPSTPTIVPLTQAQIDQHRQWYQSATLSNGGLLYDDGTLQLATKIEIRGSQGRVTLFYRNKSNTAQVNNLSVTVNDSGSLLRMDVGPLQSALAPLSQADQRVMVECMAPVATGPSLTINYTDSITGQRNTTLLLPLMIASFNEPVSLSPSDFHNRWNMLVGPGQEGQERFTTKRPLSHDILVQFISSALKFQIIEDTPQYITGAASLRTGALNQSTGEKITYGCLIKVELISPSNGLVVTARTVSPAATNAILQTAKTLLSEG